MKKLPCDATDSICFYHSGCTDGFSAAWAFRHLFSKSQYHRDTWEFVPWVYGRSYPQIDSPGAVVARNYFFLDCAPSLEVLKKLTESYSKKVYVIDHHVTAERAIGAYVKDGIIDTTRSGAVLTWRFLSDEPVPKLLQYVQDRDLWHHDLPSTNQINAYVNSQPFKFDIWDKLHQDLEDTQVKFDYIVDLGQAVLDYQTKEIDRMISKAHPVVLTTPGGVKVDVMAVNTSSLPSEVAHAILDKFPATQVAGCYWSDGTDNIWSLRSRRCGYDVAKLAEAFGGGGHPTASGFRRRS